MTTDVTTLGYEPDPHEVAAEVAATLHGWDDPRFRYAAATAAQVHHQAIADQFANERAGMAVALHETEEPGEKLSYQQIGDTFQVSRGRAQQLVEKGRSLRRGGTDE